MQYISDASLIVSEKIHPKEIFKKFSSGADVSIAQAILLYRFYLVQFQFNSKRHSSENSL